MPTRNVALTQHQASAVKQLVRDGRYQNANEALRAAVHLGIDDIDAGRFMTFVTAAATRRHLQFLAAHAARKG